MTTLPDLEARNAALTDFQHNLVVVAGAGTGKTSLLVGRLAYALVALHMEEHEVLALTFTENAAAEMRERLVRVLRAVEPWVQGEPIEHASDLHTLEALGFGPENLSRVRTVLESADRLPISTFHAFCARLLRRHARRLDLPPEQTMGDPDDSYVRYREEFLAYLRDQDPSAIHPALERFDPKDLRELGWALLSLPEDALGRVAAAGEPDGIADALQSLRSIRADWPKTLPKFAEHLDVLEHACMALLGDGERPAEIERKTPKPGARVPAEEREAVVDEMQRITDLVRPHILSDDDGIALAIEFLTPFLDRYRADRVRAGELTFDDVILQTRRFLMQDPSVRKEAGSGLRAVLVDEFQDTDPLQYDIVFLLCGEATPGPVDKPLDNSLRPATLFIVGDPKQSIYRFRRADIAAFDQASRRVLASGGRRCDLVANFRSAPAVLELVNHVGRTQLAEDRPYQLGYEPVQAMVTPDKQSVRLLTPTGTADLSTDERRQREGELIVQLITEMHAHGTRYGDVAVLLRAATDTSWLMRPLRAVGIPYALEGSRRFYQRHEVLVATALLTAIARPHDPVGVLGVLRSALSTAKDREIWTYVQERGQQALDFRHAALRPGRGPVDRTLAWLLELWNEVRELPVGCAVERLLGLDDWVIAEGTGFEGAQRLANLDRLLRNVLRARPIDLAAAVEFVERRTSQETEDEESALFDADYDAVRIMTVHMSKGLEFGTVIVPDLARRPVSREGSGDAQVDRVFLAGGRETIGVRFGSCRNVASFVIEQEEKRHRAAEDRRLFYVAATRAKEHLVLIQAEKNSGATWQADLAACAPLPDTTDSRTLDVELPEPIDSATEDRASIASETVTAWRAHESQVERPDVASGESTTTEPEEAPPPQLFAAAAREAQADATELGTAVHRYLALADLEGTLDESLCEALAEPTIRDDLRTMANTFHDGSLVSRLRSADRVLREVPVAYRTDDGSTRHGVLDVLLQEGSQVTVIDHKTDRVLDGDHDAAAERHREQLERYAEGVRRSLDLVTRPAMAVYFLREDVLTELTA